MIKRAEYTSTDSMDTDAKDAFSSIGVMGRCALVSKYYTGVGSRKTPKDVLLAMSRIAIRLGKSDYVLRSGGASGADTAFESALDNAEGEFRKAIYRPYHTGEDTLNGWRWRNGSKWAVTWTANNHPAWNRLNDYVKSLMVRNAFQVMGFNGTTPSEFLICWTPDGAESYEDVNHKTGGTGMAIKLAHRSGVPVYNLQNDRSWIKLKERLAEIESSMIVV